MNIKRLGNEFRVKAIRLCLSNLNPMPWSAKSGLTSRLSSTGIFSDCP
jgi:hypothetical protein